jgi:uncharacterized protein (TIGR02145 family)
MIRKNNINSINKFVLFVQILILSLFLGCGKMDENNPKNGLEIIIGDKTWLNKNLDVTCFLNGDLIPEATNIDDWFELCSMRKPAYCYYNFDASNNEKYGKLYNAFVLIDKRGLVPKGWHIPKTAEFKVFNSSYNGFKGFNFQPGGQLGQVAPSSNIKGYFFDKDIKGYLWSSYDVGVSPNISIYTFQNDGSVVEYFIFYREIGCSIRCVEKMVKLTT